MRRCEQSSRRSSVRFRHVLNLPLPLDIALVVAAGRVLLRHALRRTRTALLARIAVMLGPATGNVGGVAVASAAPVRGVGVVAVLARIAHVVLLACPGLLLKRRLTSGVDYVCDRVLNAARNAACRCDAPHRVYALRMRWRYRRHPSA